MKVFGNCFLTAVSSFTVTSDTVDFLLRRLVQPYAQDCVSFFHIVVHTPSTIYDLCTKDLQLWRVSVHTKMAPFKMRGLRFKQFGNNGPLDPVFFQINSKSVVSYVICYKQKPLPFPNYLVKVTRPLFSKHTGSIGGARRDIFQDHAHFLQFQDHHLNFQDHY